MVEGQLTRTLIRQYTFSISVGLKIYYSLSPQSIIIVALLAENGGWTTITTTGPSPGPRVWSAAAAIGHTLYIYGGLCESSVDSTKPSPRTDRHSADFWAFDFSVLSSKPL